MTKQLEEPTKQACHVFFFFFFFFKQCKVLFFSGHSQSMRHRKVVGLWTPKLRSLTEHVKGGYATNARGEMLGVSPDSCWDQ